MTDPFTLYQQADGTPLPCGSWCERAIVCSITQPCTQPCLYTDEEIPALVRGEPLTPRIVAVSTLPSRTNA